MTPESHRGRTDLRTAFIDAALDILEEPETGLDLRKVAERAGKSRTAPYLVFGKTEDGGGLEALRLAVAARGFQDLAAALSSALAAVDDPEDDLRSLARSYLAFSIERPRLFRLMFGPEASRAVTGAAAGGAARAEVDGLLEERWRLDRLVSDVIDRCVAVGALSGDVATLAVAAWALFHGFAMLLLDGQLGLAGEEPVPDEAADFLASFLLQDAALPVADAARAFAEAQAERAKGTSDPNEPQAFGDESPMVREEPPWYGAADVDLGKHRLADAHLEESVARFELRDRPPPRYEPADAPSPRPFDLVRRTLESSPALRRARQARAVIQGSRLLWIDDRPEQTEAERRTLEALGASVTTATDTWKAVDVLAMPRSPGERPFDLVVSDIARPGAPSAGVDELHLIRNAAPHVPVVFYVGRKDPGRTVPRGAFGIADEPGDLLHLVLDVLERGRS